jgi:demethylmenaquinone methyltransferase/2-methoxy-6-polyprenyl-1,4-benzoquinol methylase
MKSGEDLVGYNPPYARFGSYVADHSDLVWRRLRMEAIDHLQLEPGDRVLDVGCGTGTSFPYLLKKVGDSGEVVGVEISPYMTRKARARIEQNGWRNVHVVESPAQTAELTGTFDGLLMFATHEVLTSTQALDNMLSYLKENARVVTFGAKRTHTRLGWIFNPLLGIASKKLLPFSAPIDSQTWRLLEERLEQLAIEERLGGLMYLVWGSTTEGTLSHRCANAS